MIRVSGGNKEFPLRSIVCVYTYPTLTRNHDRGDCHANDDETQTRCTAHRRVPASSGTLSSVTLGASAHLHRRPTHCDALSHEYGMAYDSPSVARIARCLPTRQTRIDARDVPRSDTRLKTRLESSDAVRRATSRPTTFDRNPSPEVLYIPFTTNHEPSFFSKTRFLNFEHPPRSSASNPRARTREKQLI